jgi:Leucine-rich repeat (LRR) protein
MLLNAKVLSFSELNLSHNQMSKLPEELADLAELERLDISQIALPHVVYKMPKLTHLCAQNNHIFGTTAPLYNMVLLLITICQM